MSTKSQNKSKHKLKSKVFVERKSLLTELLETKNFLTVKCLLYAVLFGFVGNDIVCGLIFRKEVNYGLRLVKIGFRNFEWVILMWMSLFALSILVFYLFQLWTWLKMKHTISKFGIKLWDYIFLLLFLSYYSTIFIVLPLLTKHYNLGVVSNSVILMEAVRILMKTHSFIRHNAPLVNNYKPHSDQDFPAPTLNQYLYFFFAPTMLYRSEYPRRNDVNKTYAFQCFLEVILIIWLQSYVMDVFFIKRFENIDVLKMPWSDVFIAIMHSTVGAFLIMTTVFYLLLDRWLNGWSEILRFADRRFYEDWWTSTNYSFYLRTWNTVVQDWLFEYVYKEFYEIIIPKNKRLAKIMVFLVSAVVHEYVLIFMLDEFFPLLFINFFGLGQFLTSYYIDSKHPFFNMGMLYSLSFGNSIQLCLYTMEFYTRQYCQDTSSWSYFKPRIFNHECFNNTL
ncbi:sterol O-acyltransferase 1-like [Onthophagus taurus]|uniref:sterol O-acyltransferase 1-like n=1 Tax=Onthophagus taurus TaxID=166361 RepID=UPI0039BDE427